VIQTRKLVQPYRKAAVISIQSAGGIQALSGRGASIQYSLVGPNLQKLAFRHVTPARILINENEALFFKTRRWAD